MFSKRFYCVVIPSIALLCSQTVSAALLSDDQLLEKHFDKYYSRLFKVTFTLSYTVGKPTYIVLKNIPDISLAAVEGLAIAGVPGAIASTAKELGIERALDWLKHAMRNPAAVAIAVAKKSLKEGYDAYHRNYDRFANGLQNLSNEELEAFRKDQVLVEGYGFARILYHAADADMDAFSEKTNNTIAGFSAIESLLNSSSNLSEAALAVEILSVLKQTNSPLINYEPLQEFTASIKQAHEAYVGGEDKVSASNTWSEGEWNRINDGEDNGSMITVKKVTSERFNFSMNAYNMRRLRLRPHVGMIEGVASFAGNVSVFIDSDMDCSVEFIKQNNCIEVKLNGHNCLKYGGQGVSFDGTYCSK